MIKFSVRKMWSSSKLQKNALFLCGEVSYNRSMIKDKAIMLKYPIKNEEIMQKENKLRTELVNFYEKHVLSLQSSLKDSPDNGSMQDEINIWNESIETLKNMPKISDRPAYDENYYKMFTPTKIRHGICALLCDKWIYFCFQTSKNESPIWGERDFNIELNEKDNPIIAVNKTQVMSVEDFKKCFFLYEPNQFFDSNRFFGHKKEDLAYCSLRALSRSFQDSKNSLIFIENLKNEDLLIKDVIGDKDLNQNEIFDIKEVEKNRKEVNDLFEDIERYILIIEKNQEEKVVLAGKIIENFNDWTMF